MGTESDISTAHGGPPDPDIDSNHVKLSMADEESIPFCSKKVYRVAWGLGLRLAICCWLAILIIPLCLTIVSVHPSEVPDSMVILFVGLFIAIFLYLFVVIFTAPSSVVRESVGLISIRVSPFGIILHRINLRDVSEVYRVSFRDLFKLGFIGFPTDWSRSVAIKLTSGRAIVVSLKDPDGFVADCHR